MKSSAPATTTVSSPSEKTNPPNTRAAAKDQDGSEITNKKNPAEECEWPHRMGALDPSWLGLAVTLTGTSFAGLASRKALRARNTDAAPGDWLLATTQRTTEDDAP